MIAWHAWAYSQIFYFYPSAISAATIRYVQTSVTQIGYCGPMRSDHPDGPAYQAIKLEADR